MSSTNHDFPQDARQVAGALPTRRALLGRGLGALGSTALASLLGTSGGRLLAAGLGSAPELSPGTALGHQGPHFVPRAKHVIYLHMVGGPSQIDLFDHKPQLQEWYDKDLPE